MNRKLLPMAIPVFALAAVACDFEQADDDEMEITNDDDGDETPPNDDSMADDELTQEEGEALAEVAADTADSVSGESALVATVSVAAAEASQDAGSDEEIAEVAAAEASLTAMCAYGGTATATVVGNTVTYSFWRCSSHCGMHRATGDVVVTYSGLPDGVNVTIAAEDFRIDGIRTDLSVDADYRLTGAVASMSIDTDATVTGWFGWEITRSGNYDATFDAASVCITHDGEWMTAFGEWAYSTTLTDYRRCALECPEAGSRLEFTAPTWDFAAEFETDTTLSWEVSTGLAGSLEIPACG